MTIKNSRVRQIYTRSSFLMNAYHGFGHTSKTAMMITHNIKTFKQLSSQQKNSLPLYFRYRYQFQANFFFK